MTRHPPQWEPSVGSGLIGGAALLGGLYMFFFPYHPIAFILTFFIGALFGAWVGWTNYKGYLKEWNEKYEIKRKE